MNKVIAIVIVAAIGIGVWKFWPDIMGKVKEAQDDDEKSEKSENPPDPAPGPTPNQNNSGALSLNSNPMGAPPVGPEVANTNPGSSTNPPPVQNTSPVDVELTLRVMPDSAMSSHLRYLFTAPALLKDATWQYRITTPEQAIPWRIATPGPGENQFHFTSMRKIDMNAKVEILLDPKLQSPPAIAVFGTSGELLAGLLVREIEQRNVVHAQFNVRPANLRFTPNKPEVQIKVGAAPKNAKL